MIFYRKPVRGQNPELSGPSKGCINEGWFTKGRGKERQTPWLVPTPLSEAVTVAQYDGTFYNHGNVLHCAVSHSNGNIIKVEE